MYSQAIDQFRRQHNREPRFFGVFDRVTKQSLLECQTERGAKIHAKRHNLLTDHETAWMLENSVMLGYFFPGESGK